MSIKLARLPRPSAYELTIVLLAGLLVTLVAKIFGATGLGRIAALEKEIKLQQIEVETYIQRNQLIADEIAKFKSDPSQIEVLARYHFGMIKDDEVFIQTGN